MEAKAITLEPLIEKVEEYGKTTLELIKLRSVNKTADIASSVTSRVLLTIVVFLFAITLNTGIALWLGDVLGKPYYGFLAVAGFYLILGMILYFAHSAVKAKVKNKFILKILN